jgi:two-component system CheB/CheR fusion protein
VTEQEQDRPAGEAVDAEEPGEPGAGAPGSAPAPRIEGDLEPLLDYLRRARGFDFSAYKRTTLRRRIEKRMGQLDIEHFAAYQDYLEVHPGEFALLFNLILIKVTGFFRDPTAWDFLSDELAARLAAGRFGDDPIRVWTTGCASGEEAYSIAMTLAEVLGPDRVREHVKIYGSDVDEAALATARLAVYDQREVEGVPPHLLERYFEPVGARWSFRKDLRRSVIFGRHDLIQDAPIGRLDVLVCRNTLMYFNAEAQARILERFHFALNPGGILFLGRAETLLSYAAMFAPIELKQRIFTTVARSARSAPGLSMLRHAGQTRDLVNSGPGLAERAVDAIPLPLLVVDGEGVMAAANERARVLFGLGGRDIGSPLQDLEVSYRPADLRSLIDQATAHRRPVAVNDVTFTTLGREELTFVVEVTPLADAGAKTPPVLVVFRDVTNAARLRTELEHANRELERAYEELQSTNEELETTNEELQSTVEELETTNEELQSTNEELETMNEEMQSTNEELGAINNELRARTSELNQANAYLGTILSSLRGAVVVVDRQLLVNLWNDGAEAMWGLRSERVRGRHLSNLDIGLPLEALRGPMLRFLAGETAPQEVILPARHRSGQRFRCRVACSALLGVDGSVEGIVLLMEEMGAAVPGTGGEDGEGDGDGTAAPAGHLDASGTEAASDR